MIKEFKEFITRGNVVDLAVGVIIGGAFGKIVTSLVDDILMPLVGVICGGIDFSNLSFTIGSAVVKYGMFIQNIIDFLIVAFCIFLFVRFFNKLSELGKKGEERLAKKLGKKSEEVKEEKTSESEVSEEILLLREISKSLKNKNNK